VWDFMLAPNAECGMGIAESQDGVEPSQPFRIPNSTFRIGLPCRIVTAEPIP